EGESPIAAAPANTLGENADGTFSLRAELGGTEDIDRAPVAAFAAFRAEGDADPGGGDPEGVAAAPGAAAPANGLGEDGVRGLSMRGDEAFGDEFDIAAVAPLAALDADGDGDGLGANVPVGGLGAGGLGRDLGGGAVAPPIADRLGLKAVAAIAVGF